MKLHRLREGAAYLFLHVDFGEACGFYSSSNVLRIKCEGERQKYSEYIMYLEYFVFFPPQS